MSKPFASVVEIYKYRDMLRNMVHRDLRGRYKASFLGFAWTFLNPLLQLLVYTIVFSYVLRSGIERYYLFLFVALIPWIAISTSITDGSMAVVGQSSMVTKIYFPRRILPIITVTTCFVNMLLCMIVVLVVAQFAIGLDFLLLPYLVPAFIAEYILALGMTLIVSSVTVYVRDFQHIMGVLVMAWQFLSPVMYSIESVPPKMKVVFSLNPMTSILSIFRSVLYYKKTPDMKFLLYSLGLGVFFLVLGWAVFGRLEKRFAEEL